MFDLGNILVLLISVIIILVFRQLDRNNRSLDKVKKYSERVKDELGEFVDHRAEDIRNFAIELDVQHKTGSEILKRIKTAQDELIKRSTIFKELEERINSYDHVIKQLHDMSERVTGNLKRLQSESDFVDGVDRHIKETKAKLQELERKIPGIVEQFQKRNDDRLKATEERFLGGISSRISELMEEVESARTIVGDFSESIEGLDTRAAEITRETLDEIQNVSRNTLSQSENAFSDLERDLRSHAQAAYDTFQKNIAAVVDKGRSLEGEIFASLKDQIQRTAFETRERMTTELDLMKEDFSRKAADLREQMKSFSGDIDQVYYTKINTLTEDFSTKLAAFSSAMEEKDKLLTDLADDAHDLITKTVGDFGSQSEKLSIDFNKLRENILDRSGKLEETLKGNLKNYSGEFQNSLQKFIRDAEKERTDHEERLARIVDEGEEKFVRFDKETEEKFARIDVFLQEKETMVGDIIDSVRNESDARLEKLSRELEFKINETRAQYKGILESLGSNIDSLSHEVDTRMDAAVKLMIFNIEKSSGTAEKARKELEGRIDDQTTELNGRIDSLSHNLLERISVLRGMAEEKEAEIGSMVQGIAESMEENTRAADKTVTDSLRKANDRIESEIESLNSLSAEKYQEIENKIQEYESGIAYRFSKIEEINSDIDVLESNLRHTMDASFERLKDDFREYDVALEKLKEESRLRAEEDVRHFNEIIKTIETELSDLKNNAYQNVSEKLQVFEDDFFSNLTNRGEEMSERLEEWRKSVDDRIQDIAGNELVERTAIEKEYTEELRNKITEIQNRTYQQYEKFEDQVENFQERINERIALTDSGVKGFEDFMKKEIEESKVNSRLYFEKEFTEHDSLIQGMIKKAERDIEANLKQLVEKIELNRKELKTSIDSIESDVKVWQAQALQNLTDSENEVRSGLTSFKSDVSDTIKLMTEEFKAQKDELIIGTQEERNALKNELKEISDQILELESSLKKRTDNALEIFNREYDTFMLEIHKKIREIQNDADQRVKDFRSSAQETRDKIDAVQKKLYGKVEENYRTLSVTLEEIDKRQRGFLNQTKLFDRADSLKQTLQENIEDLKSEIIRVEAQQNEIKETEKKFANIMKLGTEASTKLSRFLTEKNRIDEMEGDFKKLINISQAVDTKLEQLTSSHDMLQEIQVRIRELETLSQDVMQKHDRLEKKSSLLDATTRNVDGNFKKIQEINDVISQIETSMADMPEQISELTEKIEVLLRHKAEADETMNRVGSLKEILTDIEQRTEKMQKAREWLAKTETRLEEITAQAREQVKLFGSIMKETGKQEKGAPSMNAREMVVRLAHQGWSVKEIAQATKLSRGEVELILELLPRS